MYIIWVLYYRALRNKGARDFFENQGRFLDVGLSLRHRARTAHKSRLRYKINKCRGACNGRYKNNVIFSDKLNDYKTFKGSFEYAPLELVLDSD